MKRVCARARVLGLYARAELATFERAGVAEHT